MKFSDNLKRITDILKCNNIELATASNLDPTITSRFRNGNRIPSEGTKTFNALIDGLCTITIEKNKEREIKNLCGNKPKLFDSISNYLVANSDDVRLKREDNTLIGYNLDILMRTLNISNVMLGKHLNKDTSLISKYKKEKRYIIKNDNLVNVIVKYFAKYANENNLVSLLYPLLKTEKPTNLEENILNFLFTKYNENSPVDEFLESLNNFKMNNIQIPSIKMLVTEDVLHSNKETYIGVDEFRDAVKRFLANVCIDNKQTTLYLYSDENMKWLTEDITFYNIWKSLMFNTLIKSNKIKIIHNLNRNMNEMFASIDAWLPLYMTGMIEPYYNIKNASDSFNHTLFIAEDSSVISSFSLPNSNNHIYNYSKDEELITNYKNQYINYLASAKPLIKIYIKNDITEKLKDESLYKNYVIDKYPNVSVKIKNDESEVLILKTDAPIILFEFAHPKMVEAFKSYMITV